MEERYLDIETEEMRRLEQLKQSLIEDMMLQNPGYEHTYLRPRPKISYAAGESE